MQRRSLLPQAAAVCVLFAAAAAAANAQKVYIDYDKTADLTKYKTFQIATTGQDDLSKVSPLAHQHLLDSLRQKLTAGGRFTEVQSDPDLYVTYHVTSKEETNVSTMGYGYGYGPGWGGGYYWGGGGWMGATTTVNTYTVGTLLFDIYDAKTKHAVWRGIASATVPSNPQKGIKKIDKAIDKLADKWQQMRTEGK
jgi:hypothetical protein